MKVSAAEITRVIEHTLLRPDATVSDIEQLCKDARTYGFITVCVNPCFVETSVQLLVGSQVKVGTVISFPLGAAETNVKVYEAEQAASRGAREIDMVMNIGMLKSGKFHSVEEEIRLVVTSVRPKGILVKVILETSLLTEDEKVRAARLAESAGADFVKTSTGFGGACATVEDVTLLRQSVQQDTGIKASGGIRTMNDVQKMLGAGANRIGTSAGVAIMKSFAAATTA